MKLQTKLLLILAPVFLIAILTTAAMDYRSARQDVVSDLRREADNIHGVLMATRRVYHHQFLDSGIPLNDDTIGFLPAHAMGRISADFKSWNDTGLTFNNVSDRPRNPANQADPIEMEAMDFYRDNPSTKERFVPFRTDEGESFYHFSRPIWVEQYCMKCHGKQEDAPATIAARYDTAYDYKVGDLRGVMSIKLPSSIVEGRAMAGANRGFWSNVATFGAAFLLVYWLLIRYAVRRLRKLQDAARRVAEGDFDCSTGISGGDEVARVASVFDKMTEALGERDEKLRASKQEIESSNESLLRQSEQLKVARATALSMMSDMQQASERAEAASKSKSEFLANMSHELRTPLTAILGFTDLLLERAADPDQVEASTIVKKNGEHLLHLINDILDLSKIEANRVSVESIACSPISIIAEVVSLVESRAKEKELRLEVRLDGSIPETIRSDPTRLRQILINLIGNAIKFTQTGSIRIVVRLLNEAGDQPELNIDVADDGIGIADDAIEHLFHPFTQADSSTTRQFGGTGLGLTISKRLVEMLGGEITVSSVLGKGSTFSFTVPTGPLDGVRLIDRVDASPDVPDVPAVEAAADRQALDCRVLLAEDGPDNQRLISFLLTNSGADVSVAENGQVALELALGSREKAKPFDVILMDMQMPVLDGYAATRKLREAGWTGPIIAVTAHAMPDDQKKCLDAGCDDYLTKPIDRHKLIEKVASFVSTLYLVGANNS